MSEKIKKMKDYIDSIIVNSIYIYILLPIFIFLGGWCKWYIGIFCTVVLLICLWKTSKTVHQQLFRFEWTGREIEITVWAILIIAFWVYFSGIGGFVHQNSDHIYRNAVYELLVEYDWPVVNQSAVGSDGMERGLMYYIGFWLPSAIVGKLLGVKIGYCFQAIWAILGIFLFYYVVCVIRKKIDLWPLAIFIFMSGLDLAGYFLLDHDLSILDGMNHMEWWSYLFQFSSFTTQLNWVYNQAIPAWLIISLLFIQKNNKNIILIWATAMLSSTFSFVGMLPFVIYFVISRKYEGKTIFHKSSWKPFIKDTFSFENVLGGGCIGIISAMYLLGNGASGKIGSFTNQIQNGASGAVANNEAASTAYTSTRGFLMVLIVFLFWEVGIYAIMAYKYQKKNALLYVMMFTFLLCPLVKVGYSKDFCMRASIPALVILFVLIVQSIDFSMQKKNYLWLIIFAMIFSIGCYTSTCEINRMIYETNYSYKNGSSIGFPAGDYDALFYGPNAGGITENSLFFKYIGK